MTEALSAAILLDRCPKSLIEVLPPLSPRHLFMQPREASAWVPRVCVHVRHIYCAMEATD